MKKRTPTKPVMESKTTQNVAGGVAVSGGSAMGIITFLRAMFPDIIPWSAEHDVTIAAVGAGVIAPLVSRIIARWRG